MLPYCWFTQKYDFSIYVGYISVDLGHPWFFSLLHPTPPKRCCSWPPVGLSRTEKKQKKLMKDEGVKVPCTTLSAHPLKIPQANNKLSRVKSSETEQSAEPLSAVEHGSDAENELSCNSLPYHRNPQERLSAGQCLSVSSRPTSRFLYYRTLGHLQPSNPG